MLTLIKKQVGLNLWARASMIQNYRNTLHGMLSDCNFKSHALFVATVLCGMLAAISWRTYTVGTSEYTKPNEWTKPTSDMLLFHVSRGSKILPLVSYTWHKHRTMVSIHESHCSWYEFGPTGLLNDPLSSSLTWWYSHISQHSHQK